MSRCVIIDAINLATTTASENLGRCVFCGDPRYVNEIKMVASERLKHFRLAPKRVLTVLTKNKNCNISKKKSKS